MSMAMRSTTIKLNYLVIHIETGRTFRRNQIRMHPSPSIWTIVITIKLLRDKEIKPYFILSITLFEILVNHACICKEDSVC
jgi:hypothetical protein